MDEQFLRRKAALIACFRAFSRLAHDVQQVGSKLAEARGCGSVLYKTKPEKGTMRLSLWAGVASLATMLCVGSTNAVAQERQGGRPDFNSDEFRQRMMDGIKDRLEIKDDAEWKAVQPLVQKVMDTQRAVMADRARGMMGGRTRGGDRGGDDNNRSDRGRGGFFGTPSPESETLQKAIESKASASELKAALAKFVEARKQKQAELEKAQAELRKVLSVRQEAIATSSGLL